MQKAAIILLILCLFVVTKAQTPDDTSIVEVQKETIAKNTAPSGIKKDSLSYPLSAEIIAEKRKPVNIPKFSASPVIDGKLDDEMWKNAAKLDTFSQYQPGDRLAPSKHTEVYIGYDEKHLYIGFKAFDEPDKVRATVAQRDGVFGEDNVRVYLDTYDDQRRAYVLGFNPLGIQQDGIFTEGEGEDFNVDILMESKGVLLPDGWSVEAKIPFKSIRYVAGKGKFWGIHVFRNIDRFNDELDSWMPIDRDVRGLMKQAGKITGLDEIQAERTLEVVPTFTVKQTGRRVNRNKFSNPPIQPEFGFTAKYSISSNITLDMAYNPDFADVEADAPVVEANQRFPIFFDERRPFFLEGVEMFKTPIMAVNTRSIQNPDIAVKLTGRVGKNSFGVLAAVDDPISGNPFDEKAYVGVLRYRRDFGKDSHFGFLSTTYSYPEKHNQVGGFDTRFRLNESTIFFAQVLGTNSRNYFYDPNIDDSVYRTGNALIYTYELASQKKLRGWGFGGVGRTKDYRADVGFVRRTNTNQYYGFTYFASEPKPKNFLVRSRINFNFNLAHDFQGRFQSTGNNVNGNVALRGNTYVGGGFWGGAEKLIEEEFGPKRNLNQQGAFFGKGERFSPQYGYWMWAEKVFSKRVSAYTNYEITYNTFDYDFGSGFKFPRVSPAALANPNNSIDPGTGKQNYFNIGVNTKPIDTLSLNLSYEKTKLTRNDTGLVAFDSNIMQFRSTYQFTPFVALKARLDYNTLNNRLFGQYTFGWTPSPGKAFYVGYSDRWSYNGGEFNPRVPGFLQMDRTFFMKVSYLFRKSL